MAIVYEWDEAKAASNLAKHGVSFLRAASVFDDPCHVFLDATRWVDGEDRHKVVGEIGGRLFTVVFT